MNYVPVLLATIIAYLLGSFPAAYLAGRLRKGVDIRQVGSHNMGAMNVFYNVGFVAGLLVLAVDIGKGALAIFLARQMGVAMPWQLLAGVAVVVGHNFPVFLGFHGGKGGATCIGILVFLMPWGIPFYLGIFGLGLLVTRYATLAYSLAFVVFPIIAWLVYQNGWFVIFAIGIVLLPAIRYIPRLLEMRGKTSGWRQVFYHRSLGDRL